MNRRPAAERGQPSALAVSSPAFVGRARELADLQRALDASPGVVLVEGEAGIGKSRLVRELLTSPAAAAHPALVVTCPPFQQPHTLGPVADALRQRIYNVAALQPSALAGVLRPLFPEWAADLPPEPEPAEDALAARDRVFRALTELLDRAGLRLLVAEDVQWADEVTGEFLLYLAARRPRQTALVMTCRPEDTTVASPARQLISALASAPGGLRLALGPLDVAGTAELLSSMLAGQPVSGEFAQFVHDRTEGVPLAVEESVRMMSERDDLTRRSGEWVRRRLADIDVPPTIRDSVLERARRLSAAAQLVLQAAATVAQPASAAVLAAVCQLAPASARAGLTAAAGSGLLVEDDRGQASFRHVLAQRAIYDIIPAEQRRILHRRAGQVLEEVSPPPLAQLARHFREAGVISRWRRYAEQSAELALAAGDEATAAVLICDLISNSTQPDGAAISLLDRLGFASLPSPARYQEDLLAVLRGALAARTMTASEEGAIRFQIGRILRLMDNFEGTRAELERAIPLLSGDPARAARAMSILGWAHDSGSPARVYSRWLLQAAELAKSLEPGAALRMQVDRITALLMLGEEEGWTEAARFSADPATPQERQLVTVGQLNAGDIGILWGRLDQARTRLAAALRLAETYDYARYREVILMNQAHLDWACGNWSGLADRVRPLLESPEGRPGRPEALLVTGLLEVATGSPGPAQDRFAEVLAERRRRGETVYSMTPAAALARLALASGQFAEVLRVTDEPIAIVAGKGIWFWAAEVAPPRVAALTAAGRAAEGAELTEAFGRGLAGRNIPAASAGLTLCQALLAEASSEQLRAATLFGRAAESYLAMPRPYDALLARERQAACLLQAGRADAGLTIWRRTAQQLASLGATADAQRVAERLRPYGTLVKRPWAGRPGYGDQLSPRELDVTRLLAGGGTNSEIAERLYLSPKTVARHLESAKRKLGVGSRTALAVRAVELGLITPGSGGAAAS